MTATPAFGYPLVQWGVAANRHPVHEVSSRNRWSQPFGVEVPRPLFRQTVRSAAVGLPGPLIGDPRSGANPRWWDGLVRPGSHKGSLRCEDIERTDP
jgi:hypothetical protein